ncbi:MAG: hypothetical protein JJV98_06290 [Desulfosarcina sp.]|nr:hypothetical protein [Desulfobacterales bacterium]
MSGKTWQWARWMLLLIGVLLAGCASLRGGGFAQAAAPALALTADNLQPGLAVLYFPKTFVRHVDALPRGEDARAKGTPGPAVSNLNRRFGRGQVFNSGTNRGIGIEMSGYIRLAQPGRYQFQVNSNDGFRLFIDGREILKDPVWHSSGDRLTPAADLEVAAPAWYSLRIRYFQRKGTATFQFYWRPPGSTEFQPVPGQVLAHLRPY